MSNKPINFKYLVGQVMIDKCYLTTKKLGRIIIIEKQQLFHRLTTSLFPASTGINRFTTFCKDCYKTVPRKYGD